MIIIDFFKIYSNWGGATTSLSRTAANANAKSSVNTACTTDYLTVCIIYYYL